MDEESVWLRNNARVRLVATFLLADGLLLLTLAVVFSNWPPWARVATGAAGTLAGLLALSLTYLNGGHRLTCRSDQLFLRFGMRRPVPLPLAIVEAFLASEESLPAAAAGLPANLTSRNVVIRLAERAVEWHDLDLPAVWGRWCGGYILIRGLWCQPITWPLLRELNEQLVKAQRDPCTRSS